MKGNKKILVIAILLLLISVSFTTYAIYKTSVAGNAKVTAATWNVAFKNGQDTLTQNFELNFTGSDCTNNHVVTGKIAPGVTCTKTITLDATGTEVDVAYTATAGTVTAEKGGSAVSTAGANDFTVTLSPENGTIAYGAATRTQEITVSVAWAGTEEATTTDPADTALNGATITVPVTLVAKQDMS